MSTGSNIANGLVVVKEMGILPLTTAREPMTRPSATEVWTPAVSIVHDRLNTRFVLAIITTSYQFSLNVDLRSSICRLGLGE